MHSIFALRNRPSAIAGTIARKETTNQHYLVYIGMKEDEMNNNVKQVEPTAQQKNGPRNGLHHKEKYRSYQIHSFPSQDMSRVNGRQGKTSTMGPFISTKEVESTKLTLYTSHKCPERTQKTKQKERISGHPRPRQGAELITQTPPHAVAVSLVFARVLRVADGGYLHMTRWLRCRSMYRAR